MAVKQAFCLPDLGEGLTEAEVVNWFVGEGDRVLLNQPIVAVETAKAQVEIPSPFAGLVVELHAAAGSSVQVGAPLVTFELPDVEGSDAAASKPKRREVLVGYGPQEDDPASPLRRSRRIQWERPVPTTRPVAPPLRKLARDLGVNLADVPASDPGGKISRDDILAAHQAQVAGTAPENCETRAPDTDPPQQDDLLIERIPITATRRSIAGKMRRSLSEIPQASIWLQIDATPLLEAGEGPVPGSRQTDRVTPLVLTVRALSLALRHHPVVNSTWDEERQEIVVRTAHHVGIATDTGRGLLVPVVRDVNRLSVEGLAPEVKRVVGGARAGSLRPQDLTGSTITLSNIGPTGVEGGTPIINHPESAIVALGAILRRPWVLGDGLAVRDVATLSFTFDHRAIDGAEAGRFLRRLGDLLEQPASILGGG